MERADDGAGPPPSWRPPAAYVRVAALAVAVAAVPFVGTLFDWGWQPFRRAVPSGLSADFYDLQGRALLHGRLDVPRGSLLLEAFRVDGREYLYQPPFPALVRLPILLVTDRFDGRLTAPSMLVAWLLALAMTVLLVWRIRTMLVGSSPPTRFELAVVGALVVAVGGGSSLVLLAALPWVYHETYVWATATSLAAAWALIGVVERPTGRRVVLLAAAVAAAVMTRSTQGWWWCGAAIVAGLVVGRGRGARRGALVALAGAGPLLLSVGVNLAKFGMPFGIPLDRQLLTAVSPHRQAALDATGGSMFSVRYLPTTALAYLRPDGIRFTSWFPWIDLPGRPPRLVGRPVFDEVYRTGSVTAFDLALVALAVVALFGARRWVRRPGLALAVGAASLAPVAVLTFGYLAARYVAEFLPAVVLLAIVGVVLVATAQRGIRARRGALAALAALVAFGVAANSAAGLISARTQARGAPLAALVARRATLGGGGVERLDELPGVGAPAGVIAVVGECTAVHLATGSPYQPWEPVAVGGVELSFTPSTAATTPFDLVVFPGSPAGSVVTDGTEVRLGDHVRAIGGSAARVDVRPDEARGQYVVSVDGAPLGEVSMLQWDAALTSRAVPLVVADLPPDVVVTREPPPGWCDDL